MKDNVVTIYKYRYEGDDGGHVHTLGKCVFYQRIVY